MKLIGVTGKPGAGKTTFSEIYASKDNVGVIHVDDLVAKAKKKYFTMFLQPQENNTTEHTKENPKLHVGAKRFFFKNKIGFSFLMFVRGKLVEKGLEEQINKLRLEGKRIILIDDCFLKVNKKVFNKLDKIYLLERDFISRRQGVKIREDATEEELRLKDLPYAIGAYKECTGDKIKIIKNPNSLEELKKIVDEEYEQEGELSFNERYYVGDKVNLQSRIVNSVDSLKKLRKNKEEEQK